MEAQIWSFLLGVGLEELVRRDVLQTHQTMGHILRRHSVNPLLTLMRERNVDLLENGSGWSLNVNGEFMNSTSPSLKSENVSELDQPGHIFHRKNPFINPFFDLGSEDED